MSGSEGWCAISIVAPRGWNASLGQESNVLAIKVWKTFSNSEDGHKWAKDMQANDLLDANVYLVQMRRWLPLPPPNGVKAETGDPRVDEIVNAGREAAVKATEEREERARLAREAAMQKERELIALKEQESIAEGTGAGAGAGAGEGGSGTGSGLLEESPNAESEQ